MGVEKVVRGVGLLLAAIYIQLLALSFGSEAYHELTAFVALLLGLPLFLGGLSIVWPGALTGGEGQ